MRRTSMRRWLRSALLAVVTSLAVVMITTPADTQPKQEAKARKRLRKIRDKILRKKVGLTDDKAKKVVAIFKADAGERRTVDKRLRKARRALNKLIKSDSDDQQAYASALQELEQTHADLAALRAQQLAALKKLLTPKEQARLLKAMHLVKRRLNARKHRKRDRKRRRPRK